MKVKEYWNSVHKDMAQSQISCDGTERCSFVSNNYQDQWSIPSGNI